MKAPTVLATRDRFQAFQGILKRDIRPGMKLASIPCGVMADFLTLDESVVGECELTGIDLDEASLQLAEDFARERGKLDQCRFLQADAWDVGIEEEFDIVTSNGLNIYESDDSRVTELYRSFASVLKPGGFLLTSFLTPPPMHEKPCGWNMLRINLPNLLLQKKVFMDTLDASWASYRTKDETRQQLEEAGFAEVKIVPGKTGIFPTVIAGKG